MSNYSKEVLDVLDHSILSAFRRKNELNIVKNSSDFSRNRKLNFHDLMKIIIFMSSKPIKEELWDYFDYDEDVATSGAFVQAREKLLPNAFQAVFHMMNKHFPCDTTYHGYHLIAIDGSDLAISRDENDQETFIYKGENIKNCNLYHINSAYDILNYRYIDMIIHGAQHHSEQASMHIMAERYKHDKAIFIADRNYATWNVMEHIKQANQNFLIRSKDIHASTGLLRKFNLPDSEFDLDVEVILTDKQTNEVKNNPSKYRAISTTTTFDYITPEQRFYTMMFRVVRFKIEGQEEYESILTNLSREQFPKKIIKELYGMRWGIEVSFRHLKYSAGLRVLHSRKRNSILQEVWARAILYNLSMVIIDKLTKKNNKTHLKWNYKINITRAIHFIREMAKRKGGVPPNLEEMISKEVLPIRTERKNPRKVKTQRFISFNYRFS